MASTDSASILAWAGSYTPHGRSQWAKTTREGRSRAVSRSRILPPFDEGPGAPVSVRKRPGEATTVALSRRVVLGLLRAVVAAVAAWWSRRRPFRVAVEGTSMASALLPGD